MEIRTFLIKYAEISLKGKNRYVFEDKLVSQIVRALHRAEGEFDVWKTSGRVYVQAKTPFDYDETVETLKRVFGIVSICPVLQFPDRGFEDLCRQVTAFVEESIPDKHRTFKVLTRRADKSYPMRSDEINAELGGVLLDAFPDLKVDVHHPDFFVHVEIREEINVYTESIPGPGGLPLGTSGKAMLLLSGGIDSPVAGYMTAKRGVTLEAVYFHAPPYTSERAKQKVVDLARQMAKYTGPIRLHIVNFTGIQMEIYEKCPHDELTILMRRYMMRIAEHFAEKDGCLALVTGESIGQVASQTMQALAVTNEVCRLPVIRPLIAFDKRDIIRLAEEIGTYETSILPYEDCCTIFVAKHPVTKPHLDVIQRSEAKLSDTIGDLMEKALSDVEIRTIE